MSEIVRRRTRRERDRSEISAVDAGGRVCAITTVRKCLDAPRFRASVPRRAAICTVTGDVVPSGSRAGESRERGGRERVQPSGGTY